MPTGDPQPKSPLVDKKEFIELDIPRSGNCLFETLFTGFQKLNIHLSDNIQNYKDLRAKAVELIKNKLTDPDPNWKVSPNKNIRAAYEHHVESQKQFKEAIELELREVIEINPHKQNLSYDERIKLMAFQSGYSAELKKELQNVKNTLNEKVPINTEEEKRRNQTSREEALDSWLDVHACDLYLDSLSQDGTWAGDLVLSVLAAHFDIPITVWTPTESKDFCKTYTYNPNDKALSSLNVLHTNEFTHYNLLLPTEQFKDEYPKLVEKQHQYKPQQYTHQYRPGWCAYYPSHENTHSDADSDDDIYESSRLNETIYPRYNERPKQEEDMTPTEYRLCRRVAVLESQLNSLQKMVLNMQQEKMMTAQFQSHCCQHCPKRKKQQDHNPEPSKKHQHSYIS